MAEKDKLKITAPEPLPEPGWTPLMELPDYGEGQQFTSGEKNRLRIAFFIHEANKTLCAKVWFGWAAEGPPGHAHGGSIMTVMDQAMGMAVFVAGYLPMAASVSVQFRKKLPLGTDATLEARVTRVDGRKIHVKSTLYSQEKNIVFAEAEALSIAQSV